MLPPDVRRKGGGFRAVVSIGGGRRWYGPTRETAELAARDAVEHRLVHRAGAKAEGCTFAEALALLERGDPVRDGTRDWRRAKYAALTGPHGWAEAFPLQLVTADSVRRYAQVRAAGGVSLATIWRHDVAMLRRLIAAAIRAGRLDSDPLAKLRAPRFRRGRYRFIGAAEVERIAQTVESSGARTSRRDAALIRFLAGTGLRRAELARLRIADIDWGREVVRVDGKTRHREVPIRGAAADALRTLCESATPTGKLFRGATTIEAIFQRLRRQHGVAISAHSLRHCFATTAVAAGVQPFVLASLLGHADIRMTWHYYSAGSPEQVDAMDRIAAALHGHRNP